MRLMIDKKGQTDWLIWAIAFFVIALVLGFLGFGFISGVSFVIAKWLAIIFVVLFVVAAIVHVIKRA